MNIFKNNLFFTSSLITPKIKFKLIIFNLQKKPFYAKKTFSFRKSIARFSHEFSFNSKLWLLTLKKIWSKQLLKNFFNLFLKNSSWLSFSDLDIIEWDDRNSFNLWIKLKNLFNSQQIYTYQIITTNKIFNKIFKNFTDVIYSTNSSNHSLFSKKYFFKEKCAWAIGLTNNLQFFIIKFFSSYIDSFFLIKKFLLLKTFSTSFFPLEKFLNYFLFFTTKRYFIFFNKTVKINDFSKFLLNFSNTLKLLDFIIFYDGLFFSKTDQFTFFPNSNFWSLQSTDSNYINLFFSSNRSNFLAFNNFKLITSNQNDDLKKNFSLGLLNSFFLKKKNLVYFLIYSLQFFLNLSIISLVWFYYLVIWFFFLNANIRTTT